MDPRWCGWRASVDGMLKWVTCVVCLHRQHGSVSDACGVLAWVAWLGKVTYLYGGHAIIIVIVIIERNTILKEKMLNFTFETPNI